ncbi:MAG: agmatinase [Candidatus Marsarchaeota archaeon]|nr:agmatinase [Candidatus Marsarchaeota archaeon]
MSYTELYLTKSPLVSLEIAGKEPKVAMFGVPFDSTSSFKPGSREGPNAFRNAYLNIEVEDHYLKASAERLPITDLGNMVLNFESEFMVDAVSKIVGELKDKGIAPGIVGGEHLLALGSARNYGGDSLVVFDAHLDYRNELCGLKISHGTWLRRLLENTSFKRVIHVGSHCTTPEEEDIYDKVKVVNVYDLEDNPDLFQKAVEGLNRVYVSIDLDVVDPAYAPGVGNPEPAGLTSRQMIKLLYGLKHTEIAGFDINELNPSMDTSGITAALAAKLYSVLAILASR